VTDATWRCESFYAAPLDSDSCLRATAAGGIDSAGCADTDATVACVVSGDSAACRAAHASTPAGWERPGFEDGRWAPAALYAPDLVTRDPAYTTFATTRFAPAAFIWTSNLNLDNRVVCRTTIDAPRP
jgi:hypothetical protein